jgi:hypothetical protein
MASELNLSYLEYAQTWIWRAEEMVRGSNAFVGRMGIVAY